MCEAGELGEVVGISADGQLRVKFSKGTWLFTKEQLITREAWAKAKAAEDKAAAKAARLQAESKAAAAAGRCTAERHAKSLFEGGLTFGGMVLKRGAVKVCDHAFCTAGLLVPRAGLGRCFDTGVCCKCAPSAPELKAYRAVRPPLCPRAALSRARNALIRTWVSFIFLFLLCVALVVW
jgi:hypothetical protein